MRSAVPWLAVLAFVCCGAVDAADDTLTPEKRAEIRELITVTGGALGVSQVADAATQNLAASFRRSKTDVPDRVFAAVNRDLVTFFEERVEAPGGFMERLIPLYHENFTHAEITQLIAFYRTPFGRKVVDGLPKLTLEVISVARVWGRMIAPEIQKRIEATLKQEGVDPPRRTDGVRP